MEKEKDGNMQEERRKARKKARGGYSSSQHRHADVCWGWPLSENCAGILMIEDEAESLLVQE